MPLSCQPRLCRRGLLIYSNHLTFNWNQNNLMDSGNLYYCLSSIPHQKKIKIHIHNKMLLLADGSQVSPRDPSPRFKSITQSISRWGLFTLWWAMGRGPAAPHSLLLSQDISYLSQVSKAQSMKAPKMNQNKKRAEDPPTQLRVIIISNSD